MVKSPEDAEDLCQDVCVRCLSRRDQFRNESELGTWLFRILANAAKDLLRQRLRRSLRDATRPARPAPALDPEEDTALRKAEQENRREEARELSSLVLARLSPRNRRLIEARFLEGLSLPEIARRMGIKEESASRALGRAAVRFREIGSRMH